MKYIISTIILSCLTMNFLIAQEFSSKIKVFMNYNHALGIKEKNALWNLDGSNGIYANSFHVKGMYSFNEMISCGIGIGADALRNPNYTTFPIYASVHFSPASHTNWYLYNNLGYSLDTKISYPGLYYEAGIGYKWLLKKNFGLFLNAGYNLKQMQNIEAKYINKIELLYTTRQSLCFGFGLFF